MKKLYAFFAAAVMAFSVPMTAHAAKHYDPNEARISYTNAPEGTVYMDILVKMDTDDENYTAFNKAPVYIGGDELSVTEESEIAQYDDDGYISLSLHHKRAESFVISTDDEDMLTMSPEGEKSSDFIDLSIAYGDFKAAYVDSEGKVLGVTGISVTEFSTKTPYGFAAEGSDLVFHRHGATPFMIGVFFFGSALLLISLPIIIMMIHRKRSKKIKPSELAKLAQKKVN